MTQQAVKDPPAQLLPSLGVLFSNFVIAASVLPLGLFVFSLLGRYFYIAELVCNFRCQLMLLLIPFAFFALVARRWWLGGLILVAIGWSMVGVVSVYVPGYQPPAGPKKLKVMSYNVLGSNSNYALVTDQILATDPDVISILEYNTRWHVALDRLNERYPYQVREPRLHGFGIAMFSKFPLLDTEVLLVTKSSTDNPFIITNVQFGDQTIRMAALHVISPVSRYRLELRNRQLVEIGEALSKDDVPTVVMGDFNCAPWSSFLFEFAKKIGCRDSRRGFGYQPTWPADKWMIRIPIDHAFVSRDVHVHGRVVGEPSESDHLPIVFEVSVAKK